MEIVIDIPEEDYRQIKEYYEKNDTVEATYSYIYHGTPLPKYHGRLIDEQQIIDRFKPIEKFKHWRVGTDGLFNVLSDAPTIIEAEGSESE